MQRLEGMVNVSDKKETKRTARARAFIRLKKGVLQLVRNRKIAKGDVLEHARVAGIMAAKKTHDLIPLCHPLRISDARISFNFEDSGIGIISEVSAIDRTGVEMEALTACAIAALTIYDMCKMYDRGMEIGDIVLLEKRGGRSGLGCPR